MDLTGRGTDPMSLQSFWRVALGTSLNAESKQGCGDGGRSKRSFHAVLPRGGVWGTMVPHSILLNQDDSPQKSGAGGAGEDWRLFSSSGTDFATRLELSGDSC